MLQNSFYLDATETNSRVIQQMQQKPILGWFNRNHSFLILQKLFYLDATETNSRVIQQKPFILDAAELILP